MAGAITQFPLKYKIEADGKQAKAEIKDVDKLINKLGGGVSLKNVVSSAKADFGSFESIVSKAADSITIPFSAAAGAIAGVATAATAAGAGIALTLFHLSKNASDYGSAIYDASVKTGLHAETLSALRVAGEQSETEFNQITKALGKFEIQLSDAANGSEKATKAVERLGLDPKKALNDLDGSLAKVFLRIQGTSNQAEKAGLAAAAFGRKLGTELLPFIDQFSGNLPALIERAKRLGQTISDEDARAADEFGDVMKDLEVQLASVGRTIGTAVMPEFTRFAHTVSDWLATNKGEIHNWATVTEEALSGLIGYWDDLTKAIQRNKQWADQQPGQAPHNLAVNDYNPKFDLFRALRERGRERLATLPLTATISGGLSSSALGNDMDDGKSGKSVKDAFKLSSRGKALVDAANKLGVSPLDLATIISFETAGTYSPSITNASGHRGLIQFGKAEQAQYGVTKGQSFEQQITGPVVKFLQDRFASVGRSTAGASLIDLYRTVLGGNPLASLTATDANGTSPLSGVMKMLSQNRPDALKTFFGGSESNAKGGAWGAEYEKFTDAQKKADEDAFNAFKTLSDRRKEIFNSVADYAITQLEREKKAEEDVGQYGNAIEITKQVAAEKIAQIKNEIAELQNQKEAQKDKGKQDEIQHQIDLKTIELQKQQIVTASMVADETVRLTELTEQQTESLRRSNKERKEQLDLYKQHQPYLITPSEDQAPGGGFFSDNKYDEIQRFGDAWENLQQRMEAAGGGMQSTIRGVGTLMIDGFESMTEAVGGAIESWALYGESIGAALKKALAAELAHIAGVATVNALYATALGFMRLAEMNYPAAGQAFISAGLWAALAAGTALGAKALGGAGNSKGGASGSGSSSSTTKQIDQNPQPYSRQTETTFMSSRNDTLFGRTMERLNTVLEKLEPMKPGDVLAAGMQQNRGAVTRQVIGDIESNSGYGNRLTRTLGTR